MEGKVIQVVSLTPQELKNMMGEIIEEKVGKKLSVLEKMVGDRKVSTAEAMGMLGIKSPKTLMAMVKRGELTSYPNGEKGRPKFLLSELIKLTK